MKVTKNILPFEAHQLKKQKEKKEKKAKVGMLLYVFHYFRKF